MKIIPSFRPSISYGQLNKTLLRLLINNVPEEAVTAFEQRFAQYLGVKYAIRVSSARWGLYYILQNLNLNKGDEVILPAFTYFAVPAAIVKAGLKPVFIDIDLANLNIDIQKIEENITEKTRVIIATHLCGFVYGLDRIINIARGHNIKVIEDCAQALGTEYKNKKVGSWGDAAYFTFGITKNFTTLGGGMIATNNDNLADVLRDKTKNILPMENKILFLKLIKAYIMKLTTSPILFPAAYYIMRMFSFFGIDIIDYLFDEKESLPIILPKRGKLNNIQAELGIMQLSEIDKKNAIRIEKGLEFYERLKDIMDVRIPLLEAEAKNIFSSCPSLVKGKRDKKRLLLAKGIDVSAGYMQDCSKLDIFMEFKRICPNASKAEQEVLYLPMYPELTDGELEYIAEMVKEALYDK